MSDSSERAMSPRLERAVRRITAPDHVEHREASSQEAGVYSAMVVNVMFESPQAFKANVPAPDAERIYEAADELSDESTQALARVSWAASRYASR
eukprot:15467534-Alexandrium_andersonii.AAC.1